MSLVASFFILGLQASACRAVTCTSPFKDINGACLHFPGSTMNWCTANEYCLSVGGELVHRSTFMSALNGRSFLPTPLRFWIGLTDFQEERGNSQSDWRWSDGTVASDVAWGIGNPTPDREKDCVSKCLLSYKMCSSFCSRTDVEPMCQPRSSPNVNRSRNYVEASVQTQLPPDEYANGACWRTLTGVTSKLRCGLLCSNEGADRCVAFYFNKVKKECRLAMHADGKFNVGGSGDWRKIRRR